MDASASTIPLSEILRFDDLNNVKVRLNLSIGSSGSALDVFDSGNFADLMEGQYWNYEKKKSFSNGQITLGLARYRDNATSVFSLCEVVEILPAVYDNNLFPGYDQVNISWLDMKRLVKKEGWRTALKNQKGIYLISDTSNGKMYVGSAYGENMLLGRWEAYVSTGHGNNKELKTLTKEHIQKYFRYSILDIFKAKYTDAEIIERESWWKNILQTRRFGYNAN